MTHWIGRDRPGLWPRETLALTDDDIEALLYAFNGIGFGPCAFEDAKAHLLQTLGESAASDNEFIEEFGAAAPALGVGAEGVHRMHDVAEKIKKLPNWLCAQLLGWVMGVHEGADAWARYARERE